MEVPTDVVVVAQGAEQTVDIPVLGARGVPGYGGLQGFLPEQSSLACDEQIIDIPVPGRGVSGSGGLQGFHPRQGPQRTVEQIVDVLVLGGGPQGFLPDPGSAAPSAVSREELEQGFFRTFPHSKKVRLRECTRTVEWLIRAERSSNSLLVMTSWYRSTPTTIARTTGTDRSGRPHWEMPPGIRPGWVMSREWPLREHRHPERADVGRGRALICAGATARPARDRNAGRRGASIQEQIVTWRWVMLPVIMQLEFQQSFLFIFLDLPQIQVNSGVPHISVVCRGMVVGVACELQ